MLRRKKISCGFKEDSVMNAFATLILFAPIALFIVGIPVLLLALHRN